MNKDIIYEIIKYLDFKDRYSFLVTNTSSFKIWKKICRGKGFSLQCLYTHGIDFLQHFFWRFHEPQSLETVFHNRPDDTKRFSKLIPGYYSVMDRYLGEIMKSLGPDSTLIIVSDHGFKPVVRDRGMKWYNLNPLLELRIHLE